MRRGHPVVVVLALLLVGVGVGALVAPGTAAPERGSAAPPAPVTRAELVCADPRQDGNDTETKVQAVAPSMPQASGGSGVGTIDEMLPERGRELASMEEPGRVITATMPAADAPALTVLGRQSLAQGLVAEQHTEWDGDMRGLSGTSCPAPGTDHWFVGGGSQVGQRTAVLLTNSAASPAQVDVTVYGKDGRLDAPGGRGVVVGARQQQELRLDALAPGAEVTAVHVEVRTGRLAASVHDTSVDGLTPRGTDWVPPAGEPSKRLVLPGYARGDGQRRLHLLAPGATDAVVQLRVVTPERSYVPAGSDVVEVPAGELTSVDLADVLGGSPATLELTSDVPLVAGGEIRTGTDDGESDVAYVSAVPPLSGPSAVLGNVDGAGTKSDLQLTAPSRDTEVTVTRFGTDGKPVSKQVKVRGQSTSTVKLNGPSTAFGVVVTPENGSGPVYAARVTVSDDDPAPLITAQAMRTAPSVVPVPRVAADTSAGLTPRG